MTTIKIRLGLFLALAIGLGALASGQTATPIGPTGKPQGSEAVQLRTKGFLIYADRALIDEATGEIELRGNVRARSVAPPKTATEWTGGRPQAAGADATVRRLRPMTLMTECLAFAADEADYDEATGNIDFRGTVTATPQRDGINRRGDTSRSPCHR